MAWLIARPFHNLGRLLALFGLSKKELTYFCPVAGNFLAILGKLTTAEEYEATIVFLRFLNCQIQQIFGSLGLGLFNGSSHSILDGLVTKRFHPAISIRAQNILKCLFPETWGPHHTANEDIHKDWRVEPALGFHVVSSLHQLLGHIGLIGATAFIHGNSPNCTGIPSSSKNFNWATDFHPWKRDLLYYDSGDGYALQLGHGFSSMETINLN